MNKVLFFIFIFSFVGSDIAWAETAEQWFNKGYEASRNKRYDEAVEYFKKVLTINPDYADAHANLGGAYINKGMLDEAIVALKKAIALDAKNVGAHYDLGIVYGKMGKVDEAISEYEETIKINPQFSRAYQNLGIIYAGKGLKDMAANSFYEAGKLSLAQGDRDGAMRAHEALEAIGAWELEKAMREKLYPAQKPK